MLKRAAQVKSPGYRLLPGFELEGLLHAGPLVEVWRARSASGELVAVKMPASRMASHPGVAVWLEREHALLAALDHPCIVRTVAFGVHRERAEAVVPRLGPRAGRLGGRGVLGGRPALVMEYLGGGDLVSLAGAPARSWLGGAAGLVSALQHLHERGFVHGDVKARNLLFADAADGEPRAKLADFGCALPIGAPHREPWGTAAHRSPRFKPLRAGPEEDVYALAVLLYELLSGRLPFGPDPVAAEPAPDSPIAAESGHGGPLAAEMAGSRRPLRPARRSGAILEPLAERVMATLLARGPDEVGTLREFADVIESVHTRLEAAESGRSAVPSRPGAHEALKLVEAS